MLKKQLRQLFLAKRQQLTAANLQNFSLVISQKFFQAFSLEEVNSLHVYLPILKHNEINTWFIIRKIWQQYLHISLVISKTNLSQKTMESYVLAANTTIIENSWNIPEPVNATHFAEEEIEMILLPLLGFDREGHRVGYGKGFYDNFLQKCKPEIIKIGLSLFEPVDKILDVHEADVKLDFCVTPAEVFSFLPPA
jgi:5-formyltetrahydrofolate cyclo-ligase